MKATSLLTGWTCRHLGDTAPGKPVTLPHDAMLAEPRTALSAGGTNTGWYEGYDYEYRRTLTVPENALVDTHILEFEGVYHNAEVWLNGQKAAFRPYGYTNFYVDCAPYLHAGENELRVIARNADQPNSRWYSGAGIYRPVQLWTARGAHIALNGVKIRTLSLDPAVVEVRVKTTAPGTVRLTVDDLPAVQQESDGEAVFTLTLDNARLWTPETPNLYTCRVSFADDEVTETFGVRKVEWGTDGFMLNGKRYIIQGACIHHDNGLLGAVCDPDAVARKVRLLKENGYNAIRSAHNPCSKASLAFFIHIAYHFSDQQRLLLPVIAVNGPSYHFFLRNTGMKTILRQPHHQRLQIIIPLPAIFHFLKCLPQSRLIQHSQRIFRIIPRYGTT